VHYSLRYLQSFVSEWIRITEGRIPGLPRLPATTDHSTRRSVAILYVGKS
jgi:hypothetical protein